jgi:hypothetical protein
VNQCQSGKVKYGGITDMKELKANLRMNCIPESLRISQRNAGFA